MNENSAKTNSRPRGRPRKDRSDLLNSVRIYGQRDGNKEGVRILAMADHRDGRQYVAVRCVVCGEEAIQRLDKVLSGRNHSCGCLEATEYKAYMQRRMNELPPKKLEAIANAYRASRDVDAVAAEFRIPAYKHALIHFCYRAWIAELDKLPEELALRVGEVVWRRGVDVAMAEFGRTRSEIHYLNHRSFVIKMRPKGLDQAENKERDQAGEKNRELFHIEIVLRHVRELVETYDSASYFKKVGEFTWAIECVEREIEMLRHEGIEDEERFSEMRKTVENSAPEHRYPGELTWGELRRQGKKLQGTLSKTYYQLQRPRVFTSLSDEGKGLARWFRATVKATLRNRTARKARHLAELRSKKVASQAKEPTSHLPIQSHHSPIAAQQYERAACAA